MADLAKVQVFVRVRSSEGGPGCVTCQGQRSLSIASTTHMAPGQHSFDCVFDSTNPRAPEGSQQKVFEQIHPLVAYVMEGYNVSVFAYGQTGSGKTHTMLGSRDQPGVIPRFCEALLSETAQLVSKEEWNITVRCSFLEIYDEKITDLLNKESGALRVREHPTTGPFVEKLTQVPVEDYNHIAELIEEGLRHRTTAATNMNSTSSRSHAIFGVEVNQISATTKKTSRVNLVDLAGSERVKQSGVSGIRLKEATRINSSLMCLAQVITSLSVGKKFVKYRDSMLTWLLRDSLGGNARTVIIATVSANVRDAEQTANTLRYASSAKKIQNEVIINEVIRPEVVTDVGSHVDDLREQLASRVGTVPQEQLDQWRTERENLENDIKRLTSENDRLRSQPDLSEEISRIRAENVRLQGELRRLSETTQVALNDQKARESWRISNANSQRPSLPALKSRGSRWAPSPRVISPTKGHLWFPSVHPGAPRPELPCAAYGCTAPGHGHQAGRPPGNPSRLRGHMAPEHPAGGWRDRQVRFVASAEAGGRDGRWDRRFDPSPSRRHSSGAHPVRYTAPGCTGGGGGLSRRSRWDAVEVPATQQFRAERRVWSRDDVSTYHGIMPRRY